MKRVLFILMLLVMTVGLRAQSFLDSLREKFSGSMQLMQEKLYVHTDKEFYFTGETIWFKMYNVDASFHELMNVSKIAYVELISADHKAIIQLKVQLNKGTGEGFIDLPSSIVSGNYVFRAYTNWMKNFNPDYFFEKRISVVNAFKNSVAGVNDTSKNRIQFFPEGGNLVNGLESKIAFEAISNSKGADVSGVIIDEQDHQVGRFASLQFGLGHFLITPQAGKTYRAICYWKDGSSTTQPLPNAYTKGYVIKLNDEGDELNLQVTTSGVAENSTLYLLVHTRQKLKVATMSSLRGGKVNFHIDKDLLAEGISHFTLFNSDRQPVCERLYFNKPVDTIRFQLLPDQTSYHIREKISISLSAMNSKNEKINASGSAAIFLLDSLQQMDQGGITAYLYLLSDLKGNIESPNYYFSSDDPNLFEVTDNLMLTHGWSRFRWENLLSNQPSAFEFLPEHNGHIINARLAGINNKQSFEGVATYLSVPAEKYQFTSAFSDRLGHVRFEMNQFYGAGDIVVQTNHEVDSSLRVDVLSPFSDAHSSRPISTLNLPQRLASSLSHQFSITEVSRVYSPSRQPTYIIPTSPDTTAFFGEPDGRYFLDDYTRFTTMEEVIHEFINQLQVRKSRDNYHVHALNTPYKVFFDNNALVLIDGVPIFDMNKLLALDPLKIKKLEVVARKFYYADSTYPGIVSLSTYEGDLGGYNLDPNALIVRYDGMQINKEFYSPAYSTAEEKKSRLPDFRTTLFWSPSLHVGDSNNSAIQFFSSDVPGKYLVLVEGVSQNGRCGSGQLVLDIRK